MSARLNAAVFTTRGLMDGTKPLARIIHDAEADWQAIPDGDRSDDEAVVVCLLDIAALSVDASVALRGLDALPCGLQAVLRGTAWVYEPHTFGTRNPASTL